MLRTLKWKKREREPKYTVYEFCSHNCDLLSYIFPSENEEFMGTRQDDFDYVQTNEYQNREQQYATDIMLELYERFLYDNSLYNEIIQDDIASEWEREKRMTMD